MKVSRAILGTLAGFGALALISACTTVEGTNALTSAATFEREVMTETLQGLGVIPRENTKEALTTPRGPLVQPPDGTTLPPPAEDVASLLPEDNARPQLDPTGLTDEELRMIRGARVADVGNSGSRGLTPQEAQVLTARLRDYRLQQQIRGSNAQQGDFPLEMPPLHLFTNVGGTNYICLAESGELVALDDPACPPAVRAALTANNG